VVTRSRSSRNRGSIGYLHFALKAVGVGVLTYALVTDAKNAAIYVPGIILLCASQKLVKTPSD
jgi:hypothetical protein